MRAAISEAVAASDARGAIEVQHLETLVQGNTIAIDDAATSTAAAFAAAATANTKVHTTLADSTDALNALVESMLACSFNRELYNASSEECVSPIPPPPPYTGLDKDDPAVSCAAVRDEGQDSGTFWLKPDGSNTAFQAYCDQDHQDGGWMLVVKIKKDDGDQPLWRYSSNLWTSGNVLNPDNANNAPGDHKNKGYSETAFTKIRFVLGASLNDGLIEEYDADSVKALL